MHRLPTLFALGVLLALLIGPRPARAQLLFNLNPAGQQGDKGTTLTFNATLENSGTAPLFLNGSDALLTGNGLTLDASLFFQNAPLSINGGETWSGDIFTVAIAQSALPGDYTGSFTILGGLDANAQDNLARQNFLVTVVPVPEASTTISFGLLLALGLGGMVVAKRKKASAS